MNDEVTGNATYSLYQKQPKVYPREQDGKFARLRKLAVILLLGGFYGLAWLTWDGRQAVLFDLPARKFYIFGLTFWPQDFFFLTWLLVIAALSLFFFTALAGRLWCGYACPQTVWTEVFLWMEHWTEGDRNKRMKLDKGPWNWNKIWRKSAKQFLWITFALWTGFTFVGYFTPIQELAGKIISPSLGPWETFWVFFYGFATYGNAGFMREQVCKYMCPYARFQSAMFDKDTLIISYDEQRGEPRGGRSRKAERGDNGLGDCIDCQLCVQVCPTGIDIRDGLQYECIACAACVDACNSIMDKMNYPRGLVRYTTHNAVHGKQTHIIRPRMLVYATLLMILVGGLAYSMVTRTPIILDVIRDRNALYREVSGDMIENTYTLKVINQRNEARSYRLEVAGLDGLVAQNVPDPVIVEAGGVLSLPVRLQAPRDTAQGVTVIEFRITDLEEISVSIVEDSRFVGPL